MGCAFWDAFGLTVGMRHEAVEEIKKKGDLQEPEAAREAAAGAVAGRRMDMRVRLYLGVVDGMPIPAMGMPSEGQKKGNLQEPEATREAAAGAVAVRDAAELEHVGGDVLVEQPGLVCPAAAVEDGEHEHPVRSVPKYGLKTQMR